MRAAGLLELVFLAAAGFALAAAAATALAYPRLRPRLLRMEPAARARWLVLFSVLPAAAALSLTFLCFLPSLPGPVWPWRDHCLFHGGGHPHLCAVHLPETPGGAVSWAAAALVLAWLAPGVLRRLRRGSRSWRALRQLARTGGLDPARGIWVVAADAPLAVTTGLVRPRTLVSTGLLRRLPGDLLDAVLEHERAHVRRRDPLWAAASAFLSLPHWPPLRRLLLEDLRLAIEQACDEEAGAKLGDRLRVARALLSVERLLQRTRPAPGDGLAFGGSSVVPRVESLLGEARPPAREGRAGLWLAVLCAALLFLAGPLHHFTETLLGFLARY